MNNYIPIFSKSYAEYLLNLVENGNVDNYLLELFPIEAKYAAGKSIITVPDELKLIEPQEDNNFDYENSKLLYENLKLNESQASDQRLWSYLVHVRFWEYMRKRWPMEKFNEDSDLEQEKTVNKRVDYVVWHYHLKTPNRRRLIRNGLSRLWWYAHLTYDDNREDKFELTKVLVSDLDIAQNLLERAFGSNKVVLHSLLDYFKNNPELKREERRNIIKEINLIGGVKILSTLQKEVILKLITA